MPTASNTNGATRGIAWRGVEATEMRDLSYLVTFLVVMPLFATFVGLSYVGAAVHNVRRMLFGRVSPNTRTEPSVDNGGGAG